MKNHAHAMALHFLYYNFVRIHKTLKMSPAMAAGVTKRLWEIGDVVSVLEAWEAFEQGQPPTAAPGIAGTGSDIEAEGRPALIPSSSARLRAVESAFTTNSPALVGVKTRSALGPPGLRTRPPSAIGVLNNFPSAPKMPPLPPEDDFV